MDLYLLSPIRLYSMHSNNPTFTFIIGKNNVSEARNFEVGAGLRHYRSTVATINSIKHRHIFAHNVSILAVVNIG